MSSPNEYKTALYSVVRGGWRGFFDANQIMTSMESAVRRHLQSAFYAGAMECNISREEMTSEEANWIGNRVTLEMARVPPFAVAIWNGRKDGETPVKLGSLLSRADMWVLQWQRIFEQGQTFACGNYKAKWVYGDTVKHCLPAETMILTNEGEKRIDSILPGTLVLTRVGWRAVKEVFRHKYSGPLVTVKFADGNKLILTSDHLVMTVASGWVKAADLLPGDTNHSILARTDISTLEKGYAPLVYFIESKSIKNATLTVYNLEIDEQQEFFANSVLVHNCVDCSRVVGRVYRINTWDKYGWKPGSKELACGGWGCECRRVKTDEPVTPGRPPKIRGKG